MVNMMSRKQFKHLTLAEKVELITNSDGRTGTSLAEQYGVSRATVHNVLKRKFELLQSYEANVPAERKRHNACRFELVNEFVWSWFCRMRSSHVPVSGPMIKEKALDYAKLQGLDEFKASNGWLDRFKFRHNINCAMMCSKDAAARSSGRYDSTMSRSKRKVLASIEVRRRLRLKKGKMDGALDTQSEEIKPSMNNSEQLTENKDESCLQCSNDTSGLELHNQEMDSVNSVPLIMPESDAISSPLRENDVQGSHSVKETDDPVETSETISKPNGTRQTYIIYHKLPSSQMSNTNLQPVEDRTKVVCETHRKIKVEENVTDISRESIKSKAPQTTKSQDTVRVKSEPLDVTEESTSSVMDEVDKGDKDQSELKISSVETTSSEKSYSNNTLKGIIGRAVNWPAPQTTVEKEAISDPNVVRCASCCGQFPKLNHERFNLDMSQRCDAGDKLQVFCSSHCISLYRNKIQSSDNRVTCDQCGKHAPAQYYLTMSDASVRNFCAYACVMMFPSLQKKILVPLNTVTQTPPGTQWEGQTLIRGQLQTKQYVQNGQRPSVPTQQVMAPIIIKKASTASSLPVIANVMSLAPKVNKTIQFSSMDSDQSPSGPAKNSPSGPAKKSPPGPAKKVIMVQQPLNASMSNKAVQCKPFTQTRATTCMPRSVTKSTQTESTGTDNIVIPFPVPIYVPVPLAMYTTPTPFIVPVPIPVPVPCFVPTGKTAAEQILDEIQDVRDRIPNDPFEAELLRMAEDVADEPSSGDISPVKVICPDADDKSDTTNHNVDVTSQDTGVATSGDGVTDDDMIEMTLKIVAEMSEPLADLETSLDNMIAQAAETLAEADARRGTKRQTRGRQSCGRSKKPRLDAEEPEPEPVPTTPLAPPAADANALLKFTYGVNAWKHWVRNKNIQLEKASKQNPRIRLFKTDLWECSADELNYSLCLFVKEVRKPNGEYYAPDSIYYLCLGVQQFLYMNGRADNIFTDIYYEKFTECLNEIMTRFQPRVSLKGELLSRISEDQLWETKQLGAHSPHVLLNTLIYFNTRFFRLKTAENHLKLAFSHVLKAWKRNPGSTRTEYLRYFAPPPDASRKRTDDDVFEQMENTHNPMRCPVKLFDFYVSKCPESIRSRNDLFYLMPESSCVPDSSVWYSTVPLGVDAMSKMLYRIKLVKEVQEADEVTESD